MSYPHIEHTKAENGPVGQSYGTSARFPPQLSAQTPISATGSSQPPMHPTPLSYDHTLPQIPSLVPTPLNSLNSLNSSGTHTPHGHTQPSGDQPASTPYHLTHAMPAATINQGVNALSSDTNGNSSGQANSATASGNNVIPSLDSFIQGSFQRRPQEPIASQANFGHFPLGMPHAQTHYTYPHMMHGAQTVAPHAYIPESAPQPAGYSMQLGPIQIQAPGRAGTYHATNTYYPSMQPQMQPFRYNAEDRSFNPSYLNTAKTKPAPTYPEPNHGYPIPEYRIASIQPTQSLHAASTVPSLPSLMKSYDASRPSPVGPSGSSTPYSPPAQSAVLHKLVEEDATLDGKTNFRPTETKKNARPKINKLAYDSGEFKPNPAKRKKFSAEEFSFDETYANFQEVLGIQSPKADLKKVYDEVLQSPLEKYLFDFFVHRIAIFIDTFLAHEFFQVIVSELALYDETRMILDSMLCLSSLISQRLDPSSVDALCPYDYYQKCVYSVGKKVGLDKSEDPDGKILARCLISTNLLCIYEMFFVAVDSVYVKGAGGILATIMSRTDNRVSILKQSPFHSSCFWATVVCDLILSLKLECPSTFSIEKMLKSIDPTYDEFDSYEQFAHDKTSLKDVSSDYAAFIVSNERTAWWLLKIISLFNQVNDFYNQNTIVTRDDFSANARFQKWLQLRDKIEEYERKMPLFLKPLVFMPAAKETCFPKIYFKDEKTAVAAINFRLAKLLLHASLTEKLSIVEPSLIEAEKQKYPSNYTEMMAREVAGIIQTYDCDMRIWPINIHSLRQASRYVDPSSPCYESLKKLTARVIQVCSTKSNILDLLQDKEVKTRSASQASLIST